MTPTMTPSEAQSSIDANYASLTQNASSASTSEDDVWGMPKYQQNFLANLTDEEFLAQVT